MSDSQSTEKSVTYKSIDGFPGYRVGDDGSVWTCRVRGSRNAAKFTSEWVRKKLPNFGHGYFCVTLFRPGRCYTFLIHRLVLEAFVGKRPEGMQCRHLNGNPSDNRLCNLQWGTPTENHADMIRHGKSGRPCGEDRPGTVLTEALVRQIMMVRLTEGYGAIKIAITLGLEKSKVKAIEGVIQGRSWNQVTGLPNHRRLLID